MTSPNIHHGPAMLPNDSAAARAPVSLELLREGSFTLGCNYWASHAGTAMWRDWDPDVVRDDLAKLAAHGLQVLRVFPLWPDFQPIAQLRASTSTDF